MEICTIGASGTTAERFFSALKTSLVTCVVDTRLRPSSQLAGYAKQDSLAYFLREVLGIPYVHEPLFAPNAKNLKDYRAGAIDWDIYAERYADQLRNSNVHLEVETGLWGDRPALLCSETRPDHCHRRLAAEFLLDNRSGIKKIHHLGT